MRKNLLVIATLILAVAASGCLQSRNKNTANNNVNNTTNSTGSAGNAAGTTTGTGKGASNGTGATEGSGNAGTGTTGGKSSTGEVTGQSPAAGGAGSSQKYSVYINKEYKVSLEYPAGWKPNYAYMPEKYEGDGGYFMILAMSGLGMTPDEAADIEAKHKLMPYGSKPVVKPAKINGQEARFIFPSEDQDKSMKNQAALVVKYPSPVQIGSGMYYYFILIADKGHIEEISKTLKFLE